MSEREQPTEQAQGTGDGATPDPLAAELERVRTMAKAAGCNGAADWISQAWSTRKVPSRASVDA